VLFTVKTSVRCSPGAVLLVLVTVNRECRSSPSRDLESILIRSTQAKAMRT
jgi:hypothetical protein